MDASHWELFRAVAQFIKIVKSFECFLFVADMHGLTTIQDKNIYPETLKHWF